MTRDLTLSGLNIYQLDDKACAIDKQIESETENSLENRSKGALKCYKFDVYYMLKSLPFSTM